MARNRRPSRKARRRERREAQRHGLTIEDYRNRPTPRYRKRSEGFDLHEQWDRERQTEPTDRQARP